MELPTRVHGDVPTRVHGDVHARVHSTVTRGCAAHTGRVWVAGLEEREEGRRERMAEGEEEGLRVVRAREAAGKSAMRCPAKSNARNHQLRTVCTRHAFSWICFRRVCDHDPPGADVLVALCIVLRAWYAMSGTDMPY
eukprot:3078118-Rhodomonas_salina.2